MTMGYERENDAHERGYLLGQARAADNVMMSLATALEAYECSDRREQRTRRVQGQIVEAMRHLIQAYTLRDCAENRARIHSDTELLRDLLSAYAEPADVAAIGEVA